MSAGRTEREITQKQLAVFRRDTTEIEALLRQQRHDRETRAALTVLEGRKNRATVSPTETLDTEESQSPPQEELSEQPKKSNPYEGLLVLKRIEL